jgi:DNA/RNA endonuclease YhcR with UshA esterase domain
MFQYLQSMKQLLLLTAFIAFFTFNVSAQDVKTTTDTSKHRVRITEVILTPPPPNIVLSKDIAKHIGEHVTVCDKVYTARLNEGSNITLLNLGGNYPNQTVTIMIKGEDRSKFKEQPEVYYKGRTVCVSGTVIEYKGKPEIVVTDPALLKLQLTDTPISKPADL